MVRTQALLAATILVAPSCAAAWEADGFKSGMLVDQVEQILLSWGIEKGRRTGHADAKNVYTISARGSWFTFCQDRLYEYDRAFDVSLSAFTLMLEGETARLGQPEVSSRPYSATERGVWFTWQSQGEVFDLVLAQDKSRKIDVTKRYTDTKLRSMCDKE